jgi:hypothetical protein
MLNPFTNMPVEKAVLNSEVHSKVRRNEYNTLRLGIWIYLILLIFEGALRKWVLPGLATPLLIIRDPLAVWLIIMALKNQILKPNVYLTSIVAITIISLFTAIFIGHGNLLVALFGARVFLIHFPLIFIIGKTFERRDVIRMGEVILWISIPMAILIAFQFYSPQSAWVNRGVGGDIEGGGFSGANGYFRPPATFSFISGTSAFFTSVSCFVFYFWLNPGALNRLVLILATIGLMIAIPLSISRNLFFSIMLTIFFAVIAVLRKPKYLGKMVGAVFVASLVFLLFSNSSIVKTPIEAFTSRFTSANEQEGGLKGVAGNRFLGGMVDAITGSSDQPFFGHGIGMGTNVGAMLLDGSKVFLVSEGEWGRLIGEQGPLLGLAVILLRIGLCLQFFIIAYRRLQKNDMLPWMLLNFCLLSIIQGQWGQPTSLGFAIVAGGLMLAALQEKALETN